MIRLYSDELETIKLRRNNKSRIEFSTQKDYKQLTIWDYEKYDLGIAKRIICKYMNILTKFHIYLQVNHYYVDMPEDMEDLKDEEKKKIVRLNNKIIKTSKLQEDNYSFDLEFSNNISKKGWTLEGGSQIDKVFYIKR